MKKVTVGSTVFVGQTGAEATVESIGKRVKIKMQDGKFKYVAESTLTVKPDTQYKYVDTIIAYIKKHGAATIAAICASVPSKNSATGHIRPSQLGTSLHYLEETKMISRGEDGKYQLGA